MLRGLVWPKRFLLGYNDNGHKKEKKYANKEVTGKRGSKTITRCLLFSVAEYKTRYVSVFCVSIRGLDENE